MLLEQIQGQKITGIRYEILKINQAKITAAKTAVWRASY